MQRDEDDALPDELRRAVYVDSGIYDAPDWYDVDYAGYRGEEAFYRLVLQTHASASPADGAVVELGVGTGRLALRYAKEGWFIHGVEPAAPMRSLLMAKRAKEGLDDTQLAIEEGTARSFVGPRARRIDVVTFPFNGLLHVRTREELLASFAHVHDKLAPDGRFALDCTGPYWDAILHGATPWGRSDERVHPATGKTVLTCDRCTYDAATKQMRIDIRYLLEGTTQGAQIALYQTMWTWQQVLGALGETGFVVELLFGDVDMSPFDEGSPRLLVSCKKR